MEQTHSGVDGVIQTHQPTGQRVLAHMEEAARRFGLQGCLGPDWAEAQFSLSRDPADGCQILNGVWRRGDGQKFGEVTIRSDGLCWAEWDVLEPHPKRAGWFVEAMTAWGTPDNLRSEPRLLPMPGVDS